MINEILDMTFLYTAGLLLGGIFFGGLWLTLRMNLSSDKIGLWLLGSMLIRTTIVLMGFYLISGGGLLSLLICLAGFITVRLVAIRINASAEKIYQIVVELYNAPQP